MISILKYHMARSLVCVIAIAVLPAFAFPVGSADNDSLAFDMELSNFASETPELSRLDVYVKVVYDELQFIKSLPDSFVAEYSATIDVLKKGKQVDTKEFTDNIKLPSLDLSNSRQQFKMSRITFELPPDKYEVAVHVADSETKRSASRSGEIRLKEYSDKKMLTSDILFLDAMSSDANGKITFQPRVTNLQSEHARLLVYFEVYNVSESDSFHVDYEVIAGKDSVVLAKEYWSKGTGRVTQNFVDIEGEALSHGSYLAKVEVKHNKKKRKFEKSFNWYLEGLPRTFADIDQAIDVLKYMASKDEYKYLKGLREPHKYREFLRFWKKHDPTPTTTENEMRDEYYERVFYANSNFGQMSKAGWKTDRGWAHVMIGPPDTINRRPHNSGLRLGKTIKAIQVWVYYKYNRQLVFFDSNGFGAFRLENPETLYEIIK